MKLSLSMITIDRSPKTNYLQTTLENLERAGVFSSEHFEHLHIVDSGASWALQHVRGPKMSAHWTLDGRTPNANAATALRVASATVAPWVLFLEDDIDVCDDFLGSVARWLNDHARPDVPVYSFGANYDFLLDAQRRGKTYLPYAVEHFYGTLAFALRTPDARSLGDWFAVHERDIFPHGACYDLLMHSWAAERKVTQFGCAVPCFVQHIGIESFIRPGSEPIIYKGWPGREWSYGVTSCR